MPLITQWAQVNVIRLFFRSTLLIFILAISLSIMGDSAAHPVPGSDVELSHSNKLPPSYKTAISEDANESVINEQNSGAPYIVANGVNMHEVSHSEAGGWKVRAPGDDTYGNGELIVVSVEFSEPVRADSDTTFRIQMGSVNRGLVPVATRGNTVLFGALIRPQDRDGNGIWIGDNAATLDHNDADSIRSRGNPPRNADWTHPSLGTQSDHKVDGSATRPACGISKSHQRRNTLGFTCAVKRSRFPPDSTGPLLSKATYPHVSTWKLSRKLRPTTLTIQGQRHRHTGVRAHRHCL